MAALHPSAHTKASRTLTTVVNGGGEAVAVAAAAVGTPSGALTLRTVGRLGICCTFGWREERRPVPVDLASNCE